MTHTLANRKSDYKLQSLLEDEAFAREKWECEKTFNVDAPKDGDKTSPKFFATFPFPYMNGLLHLGHAFSLSKAEFSTSYERMKGKRVLFPFGFHLTGMPIKASSDKIKAEVEQFGKDFKGFKEEEEESTESNKTSGPVVAKAFARSHSKVQSKSTGSKYQFQILESMGVPRDEIHEFQFPEKWISYFPPLAISSLKELGCGIDWRRSFVTTDLNPYFDSFARWQMNRLRNTPNKIFEGERLTVYSPKDKQPCLDHDRYIGEGVGVQEYTAIKIEILLDKLDDFSEEKRFIVNKKPLGSVLLNLLKDRRGQKAYLIAATLKPETMCGQVGCTVSPKIQYGLFVSKNQEIWICSDMSARNMAYQRFFEKFGEINKIGSILGADLIGLPLSSPCTPYDVIYTLPMSLISPNVGTAIVTSVISDSVDDLMTFRELAKKPEAYGIQESWVKPFLETYPKIIQTKYGTNSAEYLINHYKIQSLNDTSKLEIARKELFNEGFYGGKVIYGEFEGMDVKDARKLCKEAMIERNQAFLYCEPERQVVSRSNDVCVVAPSHQWFLNFGEESWKKMALKCLSKLELFSKEVSNAFVKNFDWIGPWACSRQFGLGTRLPWDERYVIESLSDSVIYMAYYTVAHFLHEGSLDGSKMGIANIPPEKMSDYVWEYVLGTGKYDKSQGISKEVLDKMKNEFNYFYPVDLRVSGKDLIFNHLTFCIYAHTAIFPEDKWPLAFRCNGHSLLNGNKMSKSTGNFLTVSECLERYGADATRLALADSGDSMEDANFVEKVAEDAILKLHIEKTNIQNMVLDMAEDNFRKGPYNFFDELFAAKMRKNVENTQKSFEKFLYRECVKYGFYEFVNNFSEYCKNLKSVFKSSALGKASTYHLCLQKDLVKEYINNFVLIMAPICPHWSESIWTRNLKNSQSVRVASWPEVNFTEKDESIISSFAFVNSLIAKIRSAKSQKKINTLSSSSNNNGTKSKKILTIYVTNEYQDWQKAICKKMKENWDEVKAQTTIPEIEIIRELGLVSNKNAMPFIIEMVNLAATKGVGELDLAYPINQSETISLLQEFIKDELGFMNIHKVDVVCVDKDPSVLKSCDESRAATPGAPSYSVMVE